MTDPVIFVPNGNDIYAVPIETVKQFKLEGKRLESAREILLEENDVEGQAALRRDEYGRAYTDHGNGWKRNTYYDKWED